MTLLLDTHVLLWWLAGDGQLSPAAKAAIEDAATPVAVSAASVWEIATKVRRGRLAGGEAVAARPTAVLEEAGFAPLPVGAEHAAVAGQLPGALRDPVDRLLIAQALAESLTLVSDESLFDAYGVRRLW